MDLMWTKEQMDMAQQLVVARFLENCVAGRLMTTPALVTETETTVKTNRFDFKNATVRDRDVFGLYEPFSYCKLTKAQVDEFATMQGDMETLKNKAKAVTTLTRAASRLARWHDLLFFSGLENAKKERTNLMVEMPKPDYLPTSLYGAAQDAEKELGESPISVRQPLNEGIVSAVYGAILALESRGYYADYHLILGNTLWTELHNPPHDSTVLPRTQVEKVIADFYRTTTLPTNEALLVSKDGPTFDFVLAGDPTKQPRFEFLRVEQGDDCEEIYLFRVRERFAPRVRENRAIVRLVACDPAAKSHTEK